MKASTRFSPDRGQSGAALLYDESHLWGLLALRSLRSAGCEVTPISTAEVRAGELARYRLLYVPGGWSSNKLKALGEAGMDRTREFVSKGGLYVGVCGGAGLATGEGLGIIRVSRKPLRQRVPSLSGPVRIKPTEHWLWEGTGEPLFHLWWPSQFVANEAECEVLGRFGQMQPGAYSSDLEISETPEEQWSQIEARYGINLDPRKMQGDPLVLSSSYGQGTVLASLLHFDTPGDRRGAQVLRNIWAKSGATVTDNSHAIADMYMRPTGALEPVADLYEHGSRLGLWRERESGGMPVWRRGVRGLEYHNLYVLGSEISQRGIAVPEALRTSIAEFCMLAEGLLEKEAGALKGGQHMTFAEAPTPEIAGLRDRLFSRSKSYGGFYKEILDALDSLIYTGLRQE